MGERASSPEDHLPYRARVSEQLTFRLPVADSTVDALLDAHADALPASPDQAPAATPGWRPIATTGNSTIVHPTADAWTRHIETVTETTDADVPATLVRRLLRTYSDFIASQLPNRGAWLEASEDLSRLQLLALPPNDRLTSRSPGPLSEAVIQYPLAATTSPRAAAAQATCEVPASAPALDSRPVSVTCDYQYQTAPATSSDWDGLTIQTEVTTTTPAHTLAQTRTAVSSRDITLAEYEGPRPLAGWVVDHFLDQLAGLESVLAEQAPVCDECGPVNVPQEVVTRRPTASHAPTKRPDRLCPACYAGHLIDQTALESKAATVYAYHHSGLAPDAIAGHVDLTADAIREVLADIEEIRETSARTTQLIETTPVPSTDD